MTVFRPKISLRPEEIIRSAPWRRPSHGGERIAGLVPEMLDLVRAEGMLAPKFIYATQPVKALVAGKILLRDQTSITAPLVVEKLPGMQHLAIGVCTIGAALGGRVNALFAARKGLQALVLDEIGNVAVRKLARHAHRRIRRDARRRKLAASSALSPGSDGFSLDQQARLCQLVPADRIGVYIRGGQMMQPGKSLSFVMGLGRDMPRWKQADACRICRAAEYCRDRVMTGGGTL